MTARHAAARLAPTRRQLLALATGTLAGAAFGRPARAKDDGFRFGLTPVFLSNDLELLAALRGYLLRRGGAHR